MFASIICQTQLYRCYIFYLLQTTKFFGCPDQPSSGSTRIQRNSKAERLLLTNCKYEFVILIITTIIVQKAE